MTGFVDLRSDTVTRPSLAMRQAIASAEVGDDVLGDDPTVIRLQERCAEMLGKEAALYVPSGSMANQVAIRAICEPGDEIILDDTTHSYNYEVGGPSALSGVSIRPLDGRRGIYTASQLDAGIRPPGSHFARSRMAIIENTNNRGGGTVWPLEDVAAIRSLCQRRALWLHMDGARLLNACVARGVKPTTYTQHVDSVSMCFSKGLGAPVGSIIAGPKPFIERCHRFRKMFGGGMRQAGLLAAACIYALDHNVQRLGDDHAAAKKLANAIAELPGIGLDPKTVETNIVIFDVMPQIGTAEQFANRLRDAGVWLIAAGPKRCRAVTHLDVSTAQIDQAIEAFRQVSGSPVMA